jgi:hypothetical protein
MLPYVVVLVFNGTFKHQHFLTPEIPHPELNLAHVSAAPTVDRVHQRTGPPHGLHPRFEFTPALLRQEFERQMLRQSSVYFIHSFLYLYACVADLREDVAVWQGAR